MVVMSLGESPSTPTSATLEAEEESTPSQRLVEEGDLEEALPPLRRSIGMPPGSRPRFRVRRAALVTALALFAGMAFLSVSATAALKRRSSREGNSKDAVSHAAAPRDLRIRKAVGVGAEAPLPTYAPLRPPPDFPIQPPPSTEVVVLAEMPRPDTEKMPGETDLATPMALAPPAKADEIKAAVRTAEAAEHERIQFAWREWSQSNAAPQPQSTAEPSPERGDSAAVLHLQN